jgi:hypothetical protein
MISGFDANMLLALCVMAGALLYSSVGHAGASAYIALMALFGVPAAVMRPTALVLNIIVATLASLRYVRGGQFRWRTLWPILIGAVPMAFTGGYIQLAERHYRPLVGAVLIVSAARFLWPRRELPRSEIWSDPPVPLAVAAGAAIGLLAGLTGTGGGAFLSPLLIFAAWTSTKIASGVAAVFILCNSIAGLLGNITIVKSLPAELPLFVGAALTGAAIGTTIGLRLTAGCLQKVLGLVLLVAGLKLIGIY